MSRQRFTLDGGTAAIPVSLDFQAQAITVFNPTPNIVAVRIGSNAIPSGAATADIFITPYTAQSYPVEGAAFGIALLPVTAGNALASDPVLPLRALVTFTRGEPPPDYRTVDVGVGRAAEQAVIWARPAGTLMVGELFTFGPFDVPSNMQSLTFRDLGPQISFLGVYGQQSGVTYIEENYPAGAIEKHTATAPFFPALDTQVFVYLTASGPNNGARLTASAAQYGASFAHTSGVPRVDVLPVGASAVPVQGIAGGVALPVSGTVAGTRGDFGSLNVIPLAAYAAVTNTALPLGGGGPRIGIMLLVTVRPGVETLNVQLLDPTQNAILWTAAAAISAAGAYYFELGPGSHAAGGALTERYDLAVPHNAILRLTPSGAGGWNYLVNLQRHWGA